MNLYVCYVNDDDYSVAVAIVRADSENDATAYYKMWYKDMYGFVPYADIRCRSIPEMTDTDVVKGV